MRILGWIHPSQLPVIRTMLRATGYSMVVAEREGTRRHRYGQDLRNPYWSGSAMGAWKGMKLVKCNIDKELFQTIIYPLPMRNWDDPFWKERANLCKRSMPQ